MGLPKKTTKKTEAPSKHKIIKSEPDTTAGKIEREATTKVIDIAELISNYRGEYDLARNANQEWIAKQEKWYKKRYGIRPAQTFPWAGASNLHLPLQDKTIRKLKPEYVGILWNASPLCEFASRDASGVERAEKASWYFDWLVRTEMQSFPDVCVIADKVMEKGFYIAKTIYEKKTEPRTVVLLRDEMRAELEKNLTDKMEADILDNPEKMEILFQAMSAIWKFDRTDERDNSKMVAIANELYKGTPAIEFTIEQTTYDAPRIIPLEPEEVTVPVGTESVLDLEKAEWIDHRYTVTPAQLWADALSGKWKKSVAREILNLKNIDPDNLAGSKFKDSIKDNATRDSLLGKGLIQKELREGTSGSDRTNLITLHEVCMWYDSDGDGREERHILDYCEDYRSEDLRFIKYPLDMTCWPYVKIPFEITDNRHYSPRGTVEIQDPLATALNVQENQKINRQTLVSTPTLFYDPAKFNPGNMKFIPGQPVKVKMPVNQSVQWMLPPGGDSTYVYEEAALKTWGEEVIGSPDSAASRLNVGGTSRKTATEMNITGNEQISTRQLDLQIGQAAFSLIYQRIWSLEMQFGPDYRMAPASADGTPTKITKQEMFGQFLFTPGGKFGAQNPVLEAQKAFRRFELFNNDPFIDQYELRREMLAKDDERMAERLMKTKEQLVQEGEAMQRQQDMQEEKNFKKAIVMSRLGAKPAAQGKSQGKPRPIGGQTEITGGQIGGGNTGPRKVG